MIIMFVLIGDLKLSDGVKLEKLKNLECISVRFSDQITLRLNWYNIYFNSIYCLSDWTVELKVNKFIDQIWEN